MNNLSNSQSKRTHQLWPLILRPAKREFAFRIGFLGDQVDRFIRELLGKILEQKSFNQCNQQQNYKVDGTTDAKWLLNTLLASLYSTDRHRIVVAELSEFGHWDTKWQLKQAVDWLRSKEVQLIFFQHKWMLSPELQSVLDRSVE
ncbi:MAG: hypothetical protein AAFZ63_29260 [Bacteroidota bacterium]